MPPALPDELWTEVLSHLEYPDIIALRPVSHRFAALAMAPQLHRSMSVQLPFVPKVLPKLLPHVRHLHLELHCLTDFARRPGEWAWCSPALDLATILQSIPDNGLVSLSLPAASHAIQWDVVAPELARIGGRLEYLRIPLSGLAGRLWLTQWGSYIGSQGRGLRELDLTGTPITSLPHLDNLQHLQKLVLNCCFMLPRRVLAAFMANLPPSLEYLDISYLRQVTLDDLYALRVSPHLKTVKLVGIDHLTRADVRALQEHWSQGCPGLDYGDDWLSSPESTGLRTPTVTPPSSPPRECTSSLPGEAYLTPKTEKVSIVHSAMLETDDEAGYRQFIGEVVNGVRVHEWTKPAVFV